VRILASVVMYFCLVLACAGAEAKRNVHNNYVSPLNAHASKGFVVRQSDMVAELNTRPEDIKNSPFVPNTGKVINTERHNTLLWAGEENSDTLFQAVSPVIPGNMSSQVICIGQFQMGGGGGDKKGQAQTIYTPWRSELLNTGVHIIVVHVYLNNTGDRTPEGNVYNVSLEDIRIASARMLRTVYKSTGDRVVLVQCGYGDSDIKQIRELPNYLQSLNPIVEHGTVRTYSTIGHGGWWTLDKHIMKVLHSATAKDYEFVGDKEDFEFIYNAQTGTTPPVAPNPGQLLGLTIQDYAAFLDPFLSKKALINLYHCYSGTDYDFPTRNEKTSIAKQFKSSFEMGKEVTVVGIADLSSGRCWGKPVDENKNGSIDFDEIEIRTGPPIPEGESSWKFFTPVD